MKDSLKKNIIQLKQGPFLCAGQHQFRSLWTRDFCFSVPALLKIGCEDVVENHLSHLIAHSNEPEHLVPRVLDSMPSFYRVVSNTMLGVFSKKLTLPLWGNLKPEYLGEHKTKAFDSNLLVLLSAIEYVDHSKNYSWWEQNESKLKKIYQFYKPYLKNDLIEQDAYSDWQDSAQRKGQTSYLNILFAAVNSKLKIKNWDLLVPNKVLTDKIIDSFFDPQKGLFKNSPQINQFSLDSQLFAIYWQVFEADVLMNLYSNLKKTEFLSSPYGLCSLTNYSLDQVSWTTQLVGLKNYHGRMLWSWLMGLSAKVAQQMNDSKMAEDILFFIQQLALRDGHIAEIYDPKTTLPFRTRLYRSEWPFSWGTAKIIESLL